MPGYHFVAGGRTMLNGNMMELLSTMRPGRMAVYQWDNPLAAFLWPMNSMRRMEEEQDFDYDQLETYLMQSDCYWICRIYKSHSGLLDAYLRFKGEDRVTRYILDFDAVDVSMCLFPGHSLATSISHAGLSGHRSLCRYRSTTQQEFGNLW